MAGAFSRRTRTSLGIIVSLLALAGCGDTQDNDADKPQIKTFTIVETIAEPAFDGAIESGAPAELSFAIDGTVEAVLVADDDEIERGMTLARLDPSPVERAVEAAEAALQRALAEVAAKTSDLERKTQLVDKGLAGADVVAEAEGALEAAGEAAEDARGLVAAARGDLEKLAIVAPFDGFVVGREIEPFEDVQGGQVLFTVVETDALYAGFVIPSDGTDIQVGQPVSVEIAALDTTLDGVVSSVAESIAGDGGHTVAVDLADPPADLRPGAAVLISLVDPPAASSGYLIPVSALVTGGGDAEDVVFVFVPAESVVRKVVVVAGEVAGDSVRITDGLSPGDMIVVTGVSSLVDGQTVTAPPN